MKATIIKQAAERSITSKSKERSRWERFVLWYLNYYSGHLSTSWIIACCWTLLAIGLKLSLTDPPLFISLAPFFLWLGVFNAHMSTTVLKLLNETANEGKESID